MTAQKMPFVSIPKKSQRLFFFSPDNYYQKPRVIARLQKTPVSLMFLVCHSKLQWKQDAVSTGKNKMSNADVKVFLMVKAWLFLVPVLH